MIAISQIRQENPLKEGKMASIKKQVKQAAVRVWLWISPQVNNPRDCQANDWLVERLGETLQESEIADAIWKLARRALTLQFPGLDRPLGSCYHPRVADVLDVAYHYGNAAQRAFRKVAASAAVVATTQRELWTKFAPTEDGHYGEYKVGDIFYNPPAGKFGEKHINLCPGYLARLADAVRDSRAPELVDIVPSFFEDGWDERIAEMRRVDEVVRGKFASYIGLFTELGVETYSFRERIDLECEHGGNLCNHSTSNGNYWVDLGHDGEMDTIQEAPHVREHGNQYHIGCYAGSARVRVHDATFLITKRTELWPAGHISKLSVVVTPEASLEELRERLTNTSGSARPRVTGSKVLLGSLLGS